MDQISSFTSPQQAARADARPVTHLGGLQPAADVRAAGRRPASLGARLARGALSLIPHVSIVIAGMMIVFFIIDRMNSAMGFMENDVTKMLIFILSLSSIFTAALAIAYRRRWEDRRTKKG